MALQANISFSTGVVLEQAYVKVTNVIFRLVSYSNPEESITAVIEVYKDKAARDTGLVPVMVETYQLSGVDYSTYFDYTVLNTQDNNPTSQTYKYLKTLPQYAAAIDV